MKLQMKQSVLIAVLLVLPLTGCEKKEEPPAPQTPAPEAPASKAPAPATPAPGEAAPEPGGAPQGAPKKDTAPAQ